MVSKPDGEEKPQITLLLSSAIPFSMMTMGRLSWMVLMFSGMIMLSQSFGREGQSSLIFLLCCTILLRELYLRMLGRPVAATGSLSTLAVVSAMTDVGETVGLPGCCQ